MNPENQNNQIPPLGARDATEDELSRLERLYGPKESSFISEETKESDLLEIVESEPDEVEETEEIIFLEKEGTTEVIKDDRSYIPPVLTELGTLSTIIVNPFILPAIATLLIFQLSILSLVEEGIATGFVLIVGASTFLMPLILVWLLNKMGIVRSLSLRNRGGRVYAYIFELIALGGVSWFFAAKGSPNWVWLIFAGASACCLANLAINFFFKISSQASGLSAMISLFLIINHDGMMHENLIWWTLGTVLLAGVAGSLAIVSRRHTVWEILAGYATGFLGVYLFSLIS